MSRIYWVMPVVTTREDIYRHLRYVPICGWRMAFRAGGCE